MSKISFSILEVGGISGVNYIVEDVIRYAQEADKLSFKRFCLGEHYVSKLPWYSPDMLVPIIAGLTEKINVGVNGISLCYQSPYKVALDYKLVGSLFPSRICLGVTNAKIPPTIEKLLNMGSLSNEKCFDSHLETLLNLFHFSDNNSEEPFLPPNDGETPETWLLSSKPPNISKTLLGRINYTLSYFHQPNKAIVDIKKSIENIKDTMINLNLPIPKIGIAIAGICLKDNKSIRTALSKLPNRAPLKYYNHIVGTPDYFFDQVMDIVDYLEIDDITFYNIGLDIEEKIESINHLHTLFNL